MTTDLVPAATFDPDAVLRFLGLDPRDVKAQALVTLAQRYGLDPLAGHLVMVDRRPYITRDGLLHVAHRSGQLDGIVLDGPPTVSDGEWRCSVSVFRKDMSHPFTYPGRYPTRGGNQRYAPEMAVKVAESMALRRAFDVTGIPALDERHEDDGDQGATVERHHGRPPGRDPWATPPADDPAADVIAADDALGGALSAPARAVAERAARQTPPTEAQMRAVWARLHRHHPRDEVAARWAVGIVLGRGYVASLPALGRVAVSRFLAASDDDVAAAVALASADPVTFAHPDDVADTIDAEQLEQDMSEHLDVDALDQVRDDGPPTRPTLTSEGA